jgi:D-glycero-D-manno-heptose 1,7-bisphosphate phosphatase
MGAKAVFLDLAGTIVMPLKPESLDEIWPIPGAVGAIARLCGAGFRCPVVTAQARIEKGLFTEGEFHQWFRTFVAGIKQQGARLEGPYVCPHREATPCPCKKPSPLLYERAAKELGLQLAGAFVVGDSAVDMEAASRFGGIGCLVRTGWAQDEAVLARAQAHASFVGADLAEAAHWILAKLNSPGPGDS